MNKVYVVTYNDPYAGVEECLDSHEVFIGVFSTYEKAIAHVNLECANGLQKHHNFDIKKEEVR